MPGDPIDKVKALLKFGGQAMSAARFADAERAFHEAGQIALAAGHERMRARALARWLFALGYQGRHEETRKPIIEAFTAAIKGGKDPAAIMILHSNALRYLPTDGPEVANELKRLLPGTEAYPDDPDIARALGQVAVACNGIGEHKLAAKLLERALPVMEAVLGPAHPEVGQMLGNLADLYGTLDGYKNLAKLEPMHRRAIAIQQAALAPVHPERVTPMMNLGYLLARHGRYDEGRALLKEALAVAEKVEGPQGATPQAIRSALSGVETMLLDAKGEPSLLRAVEAAEKDAAKPLEHALALTALCRHYYARGKPKAAEPHTRKLRALGESLGEPEQALLSAEMGVPGKIYVLMNEGRAELAEKLLQGELETLERVLPAGHGDILHRQYFFGNFYRMTGRHKDALRQFERYVAGIPEKEHPARLDGLARLLDAQLELGRRKDAERSADELEKLTGRRPVMDAALNEFARQLRNVWFSLGMKESPDLIGAALKGDALACLVVGLCFAAGQGVPRSLEKARPWIEIAAKADDPMVEKIVRELGSSGDQPVNFGRVASTAQAWLERSAKP